MSDTTFNYIQTDFILRTTFSLFLSNQEMFSFKNRVNPAPVTTCILSKFKAFRRENKLEKIILTFQFKFYLSSFPRKSGNTVAPVTLPNSISFTSSYARKKSRNKYSPRSKDSSNPTHRGRVGVGAVGVWAQHAVGAWVDPDPLARNCFSPAPRIKVGINLSFIFAFYRSFLPIIKHKSELLAGTLAPPHASTTKPITTVISPLTWSPKEGNSCHTKASYLGWPATLLHKTPKKLKKHQNWDIPENTPILTNKHRFTQESSHLLCH
jgi:hypothetical protein